MRTNILFAVLSVVFVVVSLVCFLALHTPVRP